MAVVAEGNRQRIYLRADDEHERAADVDAARRRARRRAPRHDPRDFRVAELRPDAVAPTSSRTASSWR